MGGDVMPHVGLRTCHQSTNTVIRGARAARIRITLGGTPCACFTGLKLTSEIRDLGDGQLEARDLLRRGAGGCTHGRVRGEGRGMGETCRMGSCWLGTTFTEQRKGRLGFSARAV